LDLLDISITISLDYNSSHIELLLDNESLTVVSSLVTSQYDSGISPVTDCLTHNSTRLSLSLRLMLRPKASRPVCLGIKHPSGAYDQIFISVRNTEYV
jgi:hypothetical protein